LTCCVYRRFVLPMHRNHGKNGSRYLLVSST